jgi:type IV secretion system protein VirB10
MRLSRKMILIASAVALTGICIVTAYALHTSIVSAPPEQITTNHTAIADSLASAPKDYSQFPKLGPPLPGDLGGPILKAQQKGDGSTGTDARDTGAVERVQRVAQERDAARISTLFLGGSAARGTEASQPTPPSVLPTTATSAAVTPNEAAQQNNQSGKRAFLSRTSDRNTNASDHVIAPVDPNVVQAGSIIPAALITGIRSDLPGQITAQVIENVYDSPTGRILLIPQGARLIGEYDSEVSAGQNRVLLAWNRLILPNGRSILLDRQPGADGAGFSGLQDKVNNHWGGIAEAALISTVLGIGAELGAASNDPLVTALRQGSQNSINQAGEKIVQRQLNIQPSLTIRPGFPLRVIVTKDLILEPYGATP